MKYDTECLSNHTGDAGISLLTLPDWRLILCSPQIIRPSPWVVGRVCGSAGDCCYRRGYWEAIRRDGRLSCWYSQDENIKHFE